MEKTGFEQKLNVVFKGRHTKVVPPLVTVVEIGMS